MPETRDTPPRTERWFIYCALSLVPIILAALLPGVLRIPLFVIGAAVLGRGIVLLLRQPPVDRSDFEIRG